MKPAPADRAQVSCARSPIWVKPRSVGSRQVIAIKHLLVLAPHMPCRLRRRASASNSYSEPATGLTRPPNFGDCAVGSGPGDHLISARGRFIDGSTDSQKGTQQARSSNRGLEKQCEWKQGSEIQRSKIMAAFQTAQVHDHGLTRTAGDGSLSFHPTACRTVLAVKGPLRRAKPARP